MKPVDAEVWGRYGPAWKDDEGHWREECPACDEGVVDFMCALCDGHSIIPVPGKHVRYGLRKDGRQTLLIDRFKDQIVWRFDIRGDAIMIMARMNYADEGETVDIPAYLEEKKLRLERSML